MNPVLSELCLIRTILQRNYMYSKMTILWSFFKNSFVKFPVEKFGSHGMTVLYPNLCYNDLGGVL